jgi:uncharacterized protein
MGELESGHFLHNLVLFGRVLRNAGLDVTPRQIKELAQALAYVDIGQKRDFYATVRTLLVHRREDLATFNQAFELFWRRRDYDDHGAIMRALGRPAMPERHNQTFRAPAPASLDELADVPDSGRVEVRTVFTYSANELLRQKDFAEFTRDELEQAKQLLRAMPWTAGERASRRRTPGGREYFDTRAVLRRFIHYGGDIVEFQWRQTKYKPRQLVALCDISGSMETYTRVLLHFLHTMETARQDVEAFVFATRLTRITRLLRVRDVDAALRNVSETVNDWSGGTRIGDALKTFNFVWARRVLRPGAVVLIISDGWDRGEPAVLEREMARLRRSVYRLIWLNPLIGTPDYQPLTQGLQVALPFVDDFLPAHNLASIEALVAHLSELNRSTVRPARR